MKKLINEFISQYGTKVKSKESSAYVELMMDDHICIDWNDNEYYIPKNNSNYTEDDDLVYQFLNECYHV